MSHVEADPHGTILRAARWAEEHHKHDPAFVDTWTILYEIAGRVASGQLDLGDMSTTDAPWCEVIICLESKGIDVIGEARRRAGVPPMVVVPVHA